MQKHPSNYKLHCMRLVIYIEDDEKTPSIAATSKAAREITIIR